MIDLTPLEVRQKKGDFRRSFRGYDVELVNDFLDLVADRMEELVKQNMTLQDSAQSLESELTEYRHKERALSDALMTAQKLSEDARSHAEREGELLIEEARLAAESVRQEASRSLVREEDALRQVRARRDQLVQSFRRLLERELGELAVIEETLDLDADRSDLRAGPAQKKRPRRAEGTAAAAAGGPDSAGGVRVGPPSAEGGEREGARAGETDVEEASVPNASVGKRSVEKTRIEDGPVGDDDDVEEDWLKSLVEE